MDDPQGSRLFVVCGKSAEAEVLQQAFEPYGSITNIKVIKDKGVAYVKFTKASSAAHAMESLNGAVLNNGRGPKLKVLLAESPNSRAVPQTRQQVELEMARDPDNIPPRSRLFLVVPKSADGQSIKEEMSKYSDMEYCKIDLIQSKGVVFCKYAKASSALRAMEDICASSMLCGYRVKCMLAEPKSKRARLETLMAGYQPTIQNLDFAMSNLHLNSQHTPRGLHGLTDLSAVNTIGSMAGMTNLSNMAALAGKMDTLAGFSPTMSGHGIGTPGSITYGAGFSPMGISSPGMGHIVDSPSSLTLGNINSYSQMDSGILQGGPPLPLSRLRLFAVVYKGVSEDMLARLFRRFAGMEYCDLKKDKKTGKSKGYCYVNYSTHESASAAVQQLNGIEFPPNSGHRLKVMFAEPLGIKSSANSVGGSAFSTPTYQGHHLCNSSLPEEKLYKEDNNGVITGGKYVDEGHDDTKVYTALSRPLPDYALEHVFAAFGPVEYVHLDKDKRLGVVKYTNPDHARSAAQMLNGTDMLGEKLNVSTKPLAITLKK